MKNIKKELFFAFALGSLAGLAIVVILRNRQNTLETGHYFYNQKENKIRRNIANSGENKANVASGECKVNTVHDLKKKCIENTYCFKKPIYKIPTKVSYVTIADVDIVGMNRITGQIFSPKRKLANRSWHFNVRNK